MKYIDDYKLFNEAKSEVNKTPNMTVKSVDYNSSGNIDRIDMVDGLKLLPDDSDGGSSVSPTNGWVRYPELRIRKYKYIPIKIKINKGDVISFEYKYEDLGSLYGVDHIIINGDRYICSIDFTIGDGDGCLSYIIPKSKFEPLINWDLIEDAKYLALEYLDEGYTLGLNIFYYPKQINNGFILNIYNLKYNHDRTSDNWVDIIKCFDEIKSENIEYYFTLNKTFGDAPDLRDVNYRGLPPRSKKNSVDSQADPIVDNLKLRYEDLSERINRYKRLDYYFGHK